MPSIINTAINTAIGFPLCVLTFFIALSLLHYSVYNVFLLFAIADLFH